jgi:hypothetical protein
VSASTPNCALRARGRYAALLRSRAADDPELLEAQRCLREEALIAAIGRALKKAPPLTLELRARIGALLTQESGA